MFRLFYVFSSSIMAIFMVVFILLVFCVWFLTTRTTAWCDFFPASSMHWSDCSFWKKDLLEDRGNFFSTNLHQPDNFVILASFSDNKQGTISVSEIVSIWNRPCVQVNVGLVRSRPPTAHLMLHHDGCWCCHPDTNQAHHWTDYLLHIHIALCSLKEEEESI